MQKTKLPMEFFGGCYYQGDPDQKNYISVSAHPQDLTPYIKHDSRLCRWNYTALDDNALGASIFSETSLLKEYIDKIIDKVIYAENNVWRMMMFDGIIGMYWRKYNGGREICIKYCEPIKGGLKVGT